MSQIWAELINAGGHFKQLQERLTSTSEGGHTHTHTKKKVQVTVFLHIILLFPTIHFNLEDKLRYEVDHIFAQQNTYSRITPKLRSSGIYY